MVLLNAIIFTALFFAQTRGALTIIVENDISKLSVLIMSLYVLISGYVGHLCYLSDHMSDKNSKTRKKKRLSTKKSKYWLVRCRAFLSLGLLGTIFGLCVATSTNLDSTAPLGQIVAGLKKGLNTAFYTTICGIIFSLPLQAQLLILGFKVDKKIQDEKRPSNNMKRKYFHLAVH